MFKKIPALLMLLAAIALAACNTGPKGVRISKDGTSATSDRQGAAIRDLSAAEIGQRLIGKTFHAQGR
jgi:hypothetical protein